MLHIFHIWKYMSDNSQLPGHITIFKEYTFNISLSQFIFDIDFDNIIYLQGFFYSILNLLRVTSFKYSEYYLFFEFMKSIIFYLILKCIKGFPINEENCVSEIPNLRIYYLIYLPKISPPTFMR